MRMDFIDMISARPKWNAIALTVFILFAATTSTFAQCLDYHDYAHRISGVSLGGVTRHVVIADNKAFVSNSVYGLRIIDISDIYEPVILSSFGEFDVLEVADRKSVV